MNDVKSLRWGESGGIYSVERKPKKRLGGNVNRDSLGFVRVLGSRGKSDCPTTLNTSMAVVPLTHLRKLFVRMNYNKTLRLRTRVAVEGVSIMSRRAPAKSGPVPLLGSMQISPVLGLPPASAGGRSGTLTLYYIKQNSRLVVARIPLLT